MAEDKDTKLEDSGDDQQVLDGTGAPIQGDVQVDDKGNVVTQKADEGDDGAEPPSEGLSDAERNLIREHRKENRHSERQDSKQRRREAIARKDRYISALETKVADLNRRVTGHDQQITGSQVAQIDAALQNANAEVEIAAAAKSEAMKAGESAIFQEADEAWYNAKRKLEELTHLKRRFAEGGRVQTQQPRTQPLQFPAQTVELAKKWTRENAWYNPDPQSSDSDSRIVRMLDAELVAEGWDHSTPEYWDELTDRARERMPKRFAAGGGNGERQPTQITGGSRGDSGGDSPGGRSVTTTLSAERVKAAKEAGLWDDPKARARLIKRFQLFDKETAAQR